MGDVLYKMLRISPKKKLVINNAVGNLLDFVLSGVCVFVMDLFPPRFLINQVSPRQNRC